MNFMSQFLPKRPLRRTCPVSEPPHNKPHHRRTRSKWSHSSNLQSLPGKRQSIIWIRRQSLHRQQLNWQQRQHRRPHRPSKLSKKVSVKEQMTWVQVFHQKTLPLLLNLSTQQSHVVVVSDPFPHSNHTQEKDTHIFVVNTKHHQRNGETRNLTNKKHEHFFITFFRSPFFLLHLS